jgi:hypothetical protein
MLGNQMAGVPVLHQVRNYLVPIAVPAVTQDFIVLVTLVLTF